MIEKTTSCLEVKKSMRMCWRHIYKKIMASDLYGLDVKKELNNASVNGQYSLLQHKLLTEVKFKNSEMFLTT